MQIPALGLIKLSFMFFYKRIFAKGKGAAFKATINGFVGLIIIWIIGFFFGYLFVCKAHPSNYWTSLYNEKLYCNNSTQLHLGNAISDLIFDFLIIAFPIPLVWSYLFWRLYEGSITDWGLGLVTAHVARPKDWCYWDLCVGDSVSSNSSSFGFNLIDSHRKALLRRQPREWSYTFRASMPNMWRKATSTV